MAENTEKAVEKTQKNKRRWVDGLKSEFRKIVWPDKMTLAKQTAAVTIASVVLGVIIAIIDFLVQYGIDFLVK